MARAIYRWLKRALGFALGLTLCGLLQGEVSSAQTPPVALTTAAAVEQGLEAYRSGQFNDAIAIWQQILPQMGDSGDRALVYGNLALAYRQSGQFSEAIAAWEKAIALYRSLGKPLEIPPLLAEQAQAYTDLGQYERALALLEAPALHQAQLDPLVGAAIAGISGNAYSALGQYDSAISAQENSLHLARQANAPHFIATALSDLANVHRKLAEHQHYQAELAKEEGDLQARELERRSLENIQRARQLFEESIAVARTGTPLEEVRALLNYNRLLEGELHPLPPEKIQALTLAHWQRARELLPQIPESREKAYLLLNLASGFLHHPESSRIQEAESTIEQALALARALGDRKVESFAAGSLGELYEKQLQDWPRAMEYTRQAQALAQEVNAPDSLYRWQWQAGRILKAMGQQQAAIAAYKGAIVSLQSIRSDIIQAHKDLQFDFRDRVEPVYRELLALLLDSVPAVSTPASPTKARRPTAPPSALNEVINVLENLKLAEIQNFFGDDCVEIALDSARDNLSLSETQTAAIYTIILDERIYTVLQAPDQTPKYYALEVRRSELDREITQFRYLLEDRSSGRYLPSAQKLYDWLLRPLEADLAAAKPKTLLFIHDSVLRKIPMAALHDGQSFLIEKYPLAVGPSVSLTLSKSLDRTHLEALSVGLTAGKTLAQTASNLPLSFAPLEGVRAEIDAVREILGGVVLLDGDFNRANFAERVQRKNFSIVHMATHGRFGVDANSTFLLADDGPLAIEELDRILRSRSHHRPVALLTLSACQTAVGDNRSALGIAGVAVRAGVESALATLWFINDEATVPLIAEFYKQLLDPAITKAEALRRAQRMMLENMNYNHPAIWSPFVLVGNWL